jgi:hypothetical protein
MQMNKPNSKVLSVAHQLSVPQIEQALEWLDSPVASPPPQELEALSQVEWFQLDRLLQALWREKANNPLQ